MISRILYVGHIIPCGMIYPFFFIIEKSVHGFPQSFFYFFFGNPRFPEYIAILSFHFPKTILFFRPMPSDRPKL